MNSVAHPYIQVLDPTVRNADIVNRLDEENANIYNLIKSLASDSDISLAPVEFFDLSIEKSEITDNYNVLYCNVNIRNKDIIGSYEYKKILDKYLNVSCNKEDKVQKYDNLNEDYFVEYKVKPEGNLTISTILNKLVKENACRPSTYPSIFENTVYGGNSVVGFDEDILEGIVNIDEKKEALVISKKGYELLKILESETSLPLDIEFTAKMEHSLDQLSQGILEKNQVINHFTDFLNHIDLDESGGIEYLFNDEDYLEDEDESFLSKLKKDKGLNLIKKELLEFIESFVRLKGINLSIESKIELSAVVIFKLYYKGNIEKFLSRLEYDFLIRYIIGFDLNDSIWGTEYFSTIVNMYDLKDEDIEYFREILDRVI